MRAALLSIILAFFVSFEIDASNQKMGDLYNYIIEDSFKHFQENDYISEGDTLFFVWCLFDYDNKCNEYEIRTGSDRIQFYMPKLNRDFCSASVYRITMPEIDGIFLIISVVQYGAFFDKESNEISLNRASTIVYKFKYEKKLKKYICKSKEIFG